MRRIFISLALIKFWIIEHSALLALSIVTLFILFAYVLLSPKLDGSLKVNARAIHHIYQAEIDGHSVKLKVELSTGEHKTIGLPSVSTIKEGQLLCLLESKTNSGRKIYEYLSVGECN